MKSFETGEMVVLFKPNHPWHLMTFEAIKSKYTPDAYRLKYGEREILVDISEIRKLYELNSLVQDRDSSLYGVEMVVKIPLEKL